MKFIFVYNSDNGIFSTIFNVIHKLVSPSTYKCSLGALTYNTFSEKPEWATFRKHNQTEFVFLYKDEFELVYGEELNYPVVIDATNDIEVVLTKKQIDGFDTVNDLIDSMNNILKL